MTKGGQLIKTSRKARGYTQQEVANQTGYSRRTIQSWENGEHEPRDSCVEDILDFLGFSREQAEELAEHAAA
jgi:transcriptional regulator with XRE-family HTH domain